jgi:hypothetical protein
MKNLLQPTNFSIKGLLTTLAFYLATTLGYTQTNTNTRYQQGYTKKDGTYVQAHFKTETNHTNHDNFSTISNTNIYTGKEGSRAKDYTAGANNYGSGKTIQTGSGGGQYYVNDKGNKTYVPKR